MMTLTLPTVFNAISICFLSFRFVLSPYSYSSAIPGLPEIYQRQQYIPRVLRDTSQREVSLPIPESGRRRNYFRRPPTPPGIRFRTKAVPINALVPNLNACRTISAQPYLVDSVHYFRLRPSLEDSAQFGQSIDSKSSTGSGLQSIP